MGVKKQDRLNFHRLFGTKKHTKFYSCTILYL